MESDFTKANKQVCGYKEENKRKLRYNSLVYVCVYGLKQPVAAGRRTEAAEQNRGGSHLFTPKKKKSVVEEC